MNGLQHQAVRAAAALEERGKLAEACELYMRAMKLAPSDLRAQNRALQLLATLSGNGGPAELQAAGQVRTPSAPGQSGPLISVIVCSINADKFRAVCSMYRRLLESFPHEIIGIHDARSMCEGYNRGFARSRGDVLIFSHDDIDILTPDSAATLLWALERNDVVGVAGATAFPDDGMWAPLGSPHPHGLVAHKATGEKTYAMYVFGVGGALDEGMQVLDGVFFAARRGVLESMQFDADTFDGFHFYDIDFTYRAFLAGFRLAVSNQLALVHQSRGNFGADWRRYAERFLHKHAHGRGVPRATERFWGGNVIQLKSPKQVSGFCAALVGTAEAARAAPGSGALHLADALKSSIQL